MEVELSFPQGAPARGRDRLRSFACIGLLFLTVCVGQLHSQTTADLFDGSRLHEIRLDVFPADWQHLKDYFYENTYYECTFHWAYQGRLIDTGSVGIRSRGAGSRSPLKPGLRVDFNAFDPEQKFLGLKSLILRNNTQDPSQLRERLSMLFFDRMGLPAEREAHALLYVNDVYIGLYTIVESIDKDFLERNFGENDGYLYEYKLNLPYFLEYLGPDPALYSPLPFSPATHEKDPNPIPIVDMIRTINESSDQDFPRAMADYLDLKLFMRHVAVENFLAETDGIVGDAGLANVYFYRFEHKTLSQFLAWDKNSTFSFIDRSIWHRMDMNQLTRRMLVFPEFRNAYLEALAECAEIAGGSGGWLEKEVARQYSQIRDAARADPNKQCPKNGVLQPCSNEDFEGAVSFMQTFARERGDHVLQEMARDPSPNWQHFFAFAGGGQLSLTPTEGPGQVGGYTRIQPSPGRPAPAGMAVFSLRQNDTLVTEAGVPASPTFSAARVSAEFRERIRTSIAITNPNDQPVTLSFYFTNSEGQDFGNGSTRLDAQSQIVRFLDEPPFGNKSILDNTFTFTVASSLPISAIALRSIINERNEWLITTLPVAELKAPPADDVVTLPHFADGGGWTTELVLVNLTDAISTGKIEFWGSGSGTTPADPAIVIIDGQSGSTFPYALPPRCSRSLHLAGTSEKIQSGFIRIRPETGQRAPSALGIFSFRLSGITTTAAAVPAVHPVSAWRMSVEAAPAEAIQTGIAIANPSPSSTTVTLQLIGASGSSAELATTLSLPGNGQRAFFLQEIPAFQSVPLPLYGVLRISTDPGSGVGVMGLRRRINQRGEDLITVLPAQDENRPAAAGELMFPFFVNGGGFTTRLILFDDVAGQTSRGWLRFFDQSGQPVNLSFSRID